MFHNYTASWKCDSSKTLSTLVTICPNQEQIVMDYTHKLPLSLLSAHLNNPASSVLRKSSNSNWYNQCNSEQTRFDQPNIINHSINFLSWSCVKLIVKSSHHTWLSFSFSFLLLKHISSVDNVHHCDILCYFFG